MVYRVWTNWRLVNGHRVMEKMRPCERVTSFGKMEALLTIFNFGKNRRAFERASEASQRQSFIINGNWGEWAVDQRCEIEYWFYQIGFISRLVLSLIEKLTLCFSLFCNPPTKLSTVFVSQCAKYFSSIHCSWATKTRPVTVERLNVLIKAKHGCPYKTTNFSGQKLLCFYAFINFSPKLFTQFVWTR